MQRNASFAPAAAPRRRSRRAGMVVALTALALVGCATSTTPNESSAPPATSSIDQSAVAKATAVRACKTIADAGILRVKMAITILSGKKAADADIKQLVSMAVAGEQLATEAAQGDARWLPLARAASGIAGAPIDPSPGDVYSLVLKECSAQGIA